MHCDLTLPGREMHCIQQLFVILRGRADGLAMRATLQDVVQMSGNCQAGKSCHGPRW